MYKDIIKPVLDRVLGFVLLFILFPVLLVISIVILCHLRSFPFYIQSRPGHNEKIFNLIKFKTMRDAKEIDEDSLLDYKRTTKLGSILRKLSIDELPEIINIALGHMSFVGPRPLLKEYLPLYSDYQKRRHDVKPGLTGLAQVSGRNQLSWEEKFRFDVKYVENISFMMDLRIFFKTLSIIFKTNQVNQSKQVTMQKFLGEHKEHE